MKVLETERTILREFESGDVANLVRLNSDPQVMRHVLHREPWTKEKAEAYLAANDEYERYGYGRWAIISKADGEMIGWCGLRFKPEWQHTDLGYRFLPAYWGKGLATEVAGACLDFGFKSLGLSRMVSWVRPGNEASRNVLLKNGMQENGLRERDGGSFLFFEKISPHPEFIRDDRAILETPRLLLRKLHPADARIMFALNADPEVVRYTGDGAFESVEAARKFLEEYQSVYAKWNFGRWSVVLRSTGETLGWCGLRQYKENEGVDLGFRFFQKHWGKGYATESAIACTGYAFKNLKLENLIGRARVENAASLRVLEKCGMKITGEGKDCDGDIFVMEITAQNYAAARG